MQRDGFRSTLTLAGSENAAHISPSVFTTSSAHQGPKLPQPPPRSYDSLLEPISTTSPSSKHISPEALHKDLKANDPILLRMSRFALCLTILDVAEFLTECVITFDDWCFTRPPNEIYLLSDDYSEHECTVMAVHALLKHASLPIDTFMLAALILARLQSKFYDEWCELMLPHISNSQPLLRQDDERTKEVVIIAAIVCTFIITNSF